jgi:putative nucleotidyltransferase with HDIG domain
VIKGISKESLSKKTYLEVIEVLIKAIEKRDPFTAGHQRRVAFLSKAIAEEIGLPKKQVEGVYLGALIHDIGKLYVPAEILANPKKLTATEFEMIKLHVKAGYDIIKEVGFPWKASAEMVLQHHERLDGSGYPQGLKGDEICICARILAVADTVEAMSIARPYINNASLELALEEIEKGKGTLYDPLIVNACIKLFKEKNYKFKGKDVSENTRHHKQGEK